MRIAIIHLGRKGGGPPYILEMAKALSRHGVEVRAYVSAEVENRNQFEGSGLDVEYIETYDSALGFVWSVISQYKIVRLARKIKAYKPDFVYSTLIHTWDPFLFPLLKFTTRIKTIHDADRHLGADSSYIRFMHNSHFKAAEKFVILSKGFINRLTERGIKEKDILVLPHAGYTYYNQFGKEKPLNNRPTMLFFGRIEKYKGIGLILEALPFIKKSIPNVLLRIAGSGDVTPYQKQLEVNKENIELHNIWVKDEDVAGYIEDVDVVVLPYIHATQSGVIPLSYAFKKPVLITNVGCLAEQVADGKTGVVVNDLDAKLLAGKAVGMLKDREKTKEMGLAAYKYMEEHLTWDASAKKLISFLYPKTNEKT